jgi:DNA processing protein
MTGKGDRRTAPIRDSGYAAPASTGIHVTSLLRLLETGGRTLPTEDQLKFFGADGRHLSLYTAGDESLLQHPCVAVVGTREPSAMGGARARRLARELAQAGIVVISGLARGVDTEALVATLDAGGRVIAVIGTPLDKAYPAENKRLQERIYHDHLLLSQFSLGQRVYQSNFPIRNRLMAALSDATVIVEAGETSGTLHQAAECLRLGRWLFIARNLIDDSRLTWPAGFVGKPTVRVLDSTSDVLAAVKRSG